jgi:hypothetical protein
MLSESIFGFIININVINIITFRLSIILFFLSSRALVTSLVVLFETLLISLVDTSLLPRSVLLLLILVLVVDGFLDSALLGVCEFNLKSDMSTISLLISLLSSVDIVCFSLSMDIVDGYIMFSVFSLKPFDFV